MDTTLFDRHKSKVAGVLVGLFLALLMWQAGNALGTGQGWGDQRQTPEQVYFI